MAGTFKSPSLGVAGTSHDVFGIEPHTLVEATEGLVTEMKRG